MLDLYVLCLVGDFHGFLGHSRMATQYLQMEDSFWELSLASTSRGVSPYLEVAGELKQKKMCLPDWTGTQI